jgi:hypothetical protein
MIVLPLKLDRGKSVLLVSNCCCRAIVWFDLGGGGNTLFWEDLAWV